MQLMSSSQNTSWDAVIFDMYNTLLYQAGGYEGTSEYVAKILGLPLEAYRKARFLTYHAALIGTFQDAVERAEVTLQHLGLKPTLELAQKVVQAEISHRKRFLRVFLDTEATLHELKSRGIKLALVSNTTPEWEPVLESSPISNLFDAKVFSFKARATKPSAEIYLRALAQLNCSAQQCIYVGDGADDELAGAKAVGMATVAIVRNAEQSLANLKSDSIDYKISSLNELLHLVLI